MKPVSLRSLVALVVFVALNAIVSHADSISVATGLVGPTTIIPSADTITLDVTNNIMTTPGTLAFQTGTVNIGNSPIPDQVIPFSFLDSITINGVTQFLTIFGENNVTTGPDTFTIFAGVPLAFGDITFTLDSTTFAGNGTVGENLPFSLSADISQTPEPASFALLATGGLALAFFRHTRTRA